MHTYFVVMSVMYIAATALPSCTNVYKNKQIIVFFQIPSFYSELIPIQHFSDEIH